MTKIATPLDVAIKSYLDELNRLYTTGNATEHSYRPALKDFIAALLPHLTVINEPKRIKCGAPDYILQKNDLPIAFIEAKDIGDTDLDGRKQNKEQFDRYKISLNNLLFTDYLVFHFYQKGEFIEKVTLAEMNGKKIVLIKESREKFVALIEKFGQVAPQKISTAKDLAAIMAGKARLLASTIENAVKADADAHTESNLCDQMAAFDEVLIHDIKPNMFADIYAQTIVYGMFAARLHTTNPQIFSRHATTMATFIPKTNPFLRSIFHYIAGIDLDERIAWIIDDLVAAFQATDVHAVMEGYGKRTAKTDPFLHFYEDFLAAYNPKLRKSCGVWYTPSTVVSYIVRAVDDILQRDFGLKEGLACTEKIKKSITTFDTNTKQEKHKVSEFHKVQILDPATGTGSFLVEVVQKIHAKMARQKGAWQNYVTEHLLPRLHGFEFLMAPYAMAHLKLEMLLTETGYQAETDQRLEIYLTNSLEEYHAEISRNLFYNKLVEEANASSRIKRNTPVMVVLGNPPYNISSGNRGKWIQDLIALYKKDLGEKKLNLDDDYIKFIRLGHHYIDRNGEGILAYISNNSFIDGTTHRKMREELLKTFDTIYIVDLHGNSNKKEIAPDGGKDENVFDIQLGVSINLFIKTGKKKDGELAKVYHYDLFGKREDKYSFLSDNNLQSTPFSQLAPSEPFYFFVPHCVKHEVEYRRGFCLAEIFPVYNAGVKTDRDPLFIGFHRQEIEQRFRTLLSGKAETEFVEKYRIEDSSSFKITERVKAKSYDEACVAKIQYRIFDERYTYYDPTILSRPAQKVMRHFLAGANIGFVVPKIKKEDNCFFITKHIMEHKICSRYDSNSVLPLYLYPAAGTHPDAVSVMPNLKMEIVNAIAEKIKIPFDGECAIMKTTPRNQRKSAKSFTPLDLFDYIYGVLHSPAYRERYKEFLKIDFPRVPYPKDAPEFWRFAKFGGELRRVHLLEHEKLDAFNTSYAVSGDNVVTGIKYVGGKVYINATQYFGDVKQVAWDFYIGGYQPAQQWLSARKSRTLSHDDIIHYQRILSALTLTAELMQEIDVEN